MSLSVRCQMKLDVVETFEGVDVDDADATVTFNNYNEDNTYTGASGVPVTKHSEYELTMSSGTGTIDLTSLPDQNGVAAAVTFNGLKVQQIFLRNKSTNANSITVAKGASNGWTGLGSAFTFTLAPGASVQWNLKETAVDVSGSVKVIDVTGTGSQILEVKLVAG